MAKRYPVGLVGESNYQQAIRAMKVGDPVWLEREPDNPHDPAAIRVVDCDDNVLGYIPRDHWLKRAMIEEGRECPAKIKEIHGGDRGRPSRGIVLDVEVPSAREMSGKDAGVTDAPTEPKSAPAYVPIGGKAGGATGGMTRGSKVAIGIVAVLVLLTVVGQCAPDQPDPVTQVTADALATPAASASATAAAIPTTDAYQRASARTRCAAEYPDDMTMRGACTRNDVDGMKDFRAIAARHADNTDMRAALAGCLQRYTVNGATDFSMAGACARNNEEGLRDWAP